MSEPTEPGAPAPTGGGWRKKTDPDQITQADMEFAVEQKLNGDPPSVIRLKLQDRGLSPAAADQLVTGLFQAQPSTGKRLLCRLAGGAVFTIGVCLFIGNVSGAFPTFPLAGYLGMLVGGAIWGAGEAS